MIKSKQHLKEMSKGNRKILLKEEAEKEKNVKSERLQEQAEGGKLNQFNVNGPVVHWNHSGYLVTVKRAKSFTSLDTQNAVTSASIQQSKHFFTKSNTWQQIIQNTKKWFNVAEIACWIPEISFFIVVWDYTILAKISGFQQLLCIEANSN